MVHKFNALVRMNWFSLAIVGALLLGWLFPGAGEWIDRGNIAQYTVIRLIFLLSGLSLKTGELWHNAKRWPHHLAIQIFSFAIFPLVGWVLISMIGGGWPEALRVGFYLLLVLPTTITSCVVFTHLARGNGPLALFNAVAGNLLGIVLAPMLFLLLVGSGGVVIALDEWALLRKMASLIVLPLIAGQALRALLGAGATKLRINFGVLNSWGVVFIAYLAFAATVREGSLREFGMRLAGPLFLLLPLHGLMVLLAWGYARALKWHSADMIALMFCGPQKTLSLGIPMAVIILEQRPDLAGIATLPLIVYHPMQLIVSGWLAGVLRRKTDDLKE